MYRIEFAMNLPLKIFSTQQIKDADRFTIEAEGILSIDLMERAALQCAHWLQQQFSKEKAFLIFCGPGNNGGDGLAIARLLFLAGYTVRVFVLSETEVFSEDFLENKKRWQQTEQSISYITSEKDFPLISKSDLIIDAVFGTGLRRQVDGVCAACINHINARSSKIISIDIPSGLFADTSSIKSSAIIKAAVTLSFQFPKLAFFFPENAVWVGDWEILDIGLNDQFIKDQPTNHYQLTKELITSLIKPRNKFSHKGNFGHALLIAGSYGKMGAAVLAAKACLRSGTGLLTVHIPSCGNEIIQTTNPEAMVSIDTNEKLIGNEVGFHRFSAVGIGPGIGTDEITQKAVHFLLTFSESPLVLDADALNIISMHSDWLRLIPGNSILTPHPKEFERLAGTTTNDFERHELQIQLSKQYQVYIILKGAHTCISTPNGDCYFNTTGNPGMAKGGSGDVLTGIVTGLLAQGYTSLDACLISVFTHGLAGDLAKEQLGETGMIAGDLCEYLPPAFMQLNY